MYYLFVTFSFFRSTPKNLPYPCIFIPTKASFCLFQAGRKSETKNLYTTS